MINNAGMQQRFKANPNIVPEQSKTTKNDSNIAINITAFSPGITKKHVQTFVNSAAIGTVGGVAYGVVTQNTKNDIFLKKELAPYKDNINEYIKNIVQEAGSKKETTTTISLGKGKDLEINLPKANENIESYTKKTKKLIKNEVKKIIKEANKQEFYQKFEDSILKYSKIGAVLGGAVGLIWVANTFSKKKEINKTNK